MLNDIILFLSYFENSDPHYLIIFIFSQSPSISSNDDNNSIACNAYVFKYHDPSHNPEYSPFSQFTV